MSSEVCCNIRKLGFTTPNLEARRTATSSGTCPFYQGRAFYDCDYLAHQIPSASADNHQQKPFRGNDNDNFLAPSSFDAGITVYQSDEYPLSLMQPSQCADDSLSSHSSSSDNDIRASPPGYGGYCGSFGVPMSLRSDALERPMYNCIDTGEYSDTATSPYKTPALRPVMESFLGSCENNRRSRVNYKWTYRNGQCCYQTESEAEADSVHGQLCHYRTKATMAHTPLEHHIDELLISIDDELIVHFTRGDAWAFGALAKSSTSCGFFPLSCIAAQNGIHPPCRRRSSSLICVSCNSIFQSRKTLNRHLKTGRPHSVCGAYECNFCRRAFARIDVFKKHQRSHERRNGRSK